MKKQIFTLALATLLAGCSSTQDFTQGVEQSNLSFDKEDSTALRLAKSAGIDKVYDADRPKDSTLEGGLGSSITGHLLGSGSSLMTAGLAGGFVGLLKTHGKAQRAHLMMFVDAASYDEAYQKANMTLQSKAKSLFQNGSISKNEMNHNQPYNAMFSLSKNDEKCNELSSRYVKQLDGEKSTQEALASHFNNNVDCVLGLQSHDAVRVKQSDFPNLIQGERVLVSAEFFHANIPLEVVAEEILDDGMFLYIPTEYKLSAGRELGWFKYNKPAIPMVLSKENSFLFVKNHNSNKL